MPISCNPRYSYLEFYDRKAWDLIYRLVEVFAHSTNNTASRTDYEPARNTINHHLTFRWEAQLGGFGRFGVFTYVITREPDYLRDQ